MINWDLVSAFFFEQDFKGQKTAERLYQGLIVSFSLIGFVAGYIQQSFRVTFQLWLLGMVLALVLCVPGWCCLRRKRVEWLKSVDDEIPLPPKGLKAAATSEAAASSSSSNSSTNGRASRSSSTTPSGGEAGAKKRR